MTARETYNASLITANKAVVATGIAHASSEQATRDASASVAGYTTQTGTFSSLDSATRNANAARFNNWLAREQTKQASIAAAKDTLRDAGDRAPL